MKPRRFEYRRMESIEQILDDLYHYGTDATLLAGGQSLLPMMNARLAHPRILLDMNPVAALAGVQHSRGVCSIGAMTRYRALEPPDPLSRTLSLLEQAIGYVGHPAIRNIGTVGGSVAFADASAEVPAALLCLGATVRLRSKSGSRRVVMNDFLLAEGGTTRQPDELVAGLDLSLPADGERHVFQEFNLRHNGPTVVAVALRTIVDAAGDWRNVSVVAAGLRARAVFLPSVACVLAQMRATAGLDELKAAIAADVEIAATPLYSASFKLEIAAAIVQRAAMTIRE